MWETRARTDAGCETVTSWIEDSEALYLLTGPRLTWPLKAGQLKAISMRTADGCAGTSTRQHNEPAGGRDVWHLHVHVFPRYENDRLYQRHEESHWAQPSARQPYALKLRTELGMPHRFDG